MAVAIALCCHGAQMLSLSPPCRSLLWRQMPPIKQKHNRNVSSSERRWSKSYHATESQSHFDRKCCQASPVGASQGSGLHSTEFGVKVPERQLLSGKGSSDVQGRAPEPQGRDFSWKKNEKTDLYYHTTLNLPQSSKRQELDALCIAGSTLSGTGCKRQDLFTLASLAVNCPS